MKLFRPSAFCILLILFLQFAGFQVRAQFPAEGTVSNATFVSWQNQLPYWFWANQHGAVAKENSFLNLSMIDIHSASRTDTAKWNVDWGATIAGGLANISYLQLNQGYASLTHRRWQLIAGVFREKTQFSGLSISNGNLARSQNARPYPKIRFSTNGYKTLPFGKQRMAFKAEYDEGILNDNRYVKNAKLHHKSIYLAFQPAPEWYIEAGAEHFVMWGGTSPDDRYGQLPQDFKSYLRYITGSMGGENFPQTDQLNVAGNQLGTYQLKISKSFDKANATIYASHPFEDFSGVNFRNWPDNLLGFSVEMKDKTGFVTHFLYEYTNTRQQSVTDSIYVWSETDQDWKRKPFDNYYNHGYYRSGFTYHNKMMGAPLFGPVISTNGITTGIRSNRFLAHHIGLLGTINEFITWKSMITCSHHFGTWSLPYEATKKKISVLLQLTINHPRLPFNLNISAATDAGNQISTYSGFRFQVSKSF